MSAILKTRKASFLPASEQVQTDDTPQQSGMTRHNKTLSDTIGKGFASEGTEELHMLFPDIGLRYYKTDNTTRIPAITHNDKDFVSLAFVVAGTGTIISETIDQAFCLTERQHCLLFVGSSGFRIHTNHADKTEIFIVTISPALFSAIVPEKHPVRDQLQQTCSDTVIFESAIRNGYITPRR